MENRHDDAVLIIAEAGVNHNGSLERALQMIDAAALAGADAVKFQTFHPESVISRNAGKAAYQIRTTGNSESQLEMVRKLELDLSSHRLLFEHARKQNIKFLSTPFDLESVALLVNEIKVSQLKIASGEITNLPLLLFAARTGRAIILSTGMSTLGEVETALAVIAFGYSTVDEVPSEPAFRQAFGSELGQKMLRERVTLLHCTTEYPAPFSGVNLRAMDTLRNAFGLPVGISDHTQGFSVSVAAVARGATVVEKHFTMDRCLPGPDHNASLEPNELSSMVTAIREVEEALGSPLKMPAQCELGNLAIARKSLVAASRIEKGESFNARNLTVKRPGTGIAATKYWEFLGKRAHRDYESDDLIENSDIY